MTSGIGAIGFDPNQSSVTNSATSGAGFASAMDTVSLLAASTTPALEASFLAAGNTGAATIAAVTGNAVFSSSAGAAQMAGGGAPYTSGLTSGGSYLGAGGMSFQTTPGGTGEVATDVESILSDTATSQSYLIGIQAQMGFQQTQFTSISNALATKHSMERSAIQNFRS